VGHDRDRDAVRSFRLSRIGDEVTAYGARNVVRKPAGVDLRSIVDQVTINKANLSFQFISYKLAYLH
jgi:proteasome accessory factor B